MCLKHLLYGQAQSVRAVYQPTAVGDSDGGAPRPEVSLVNIESITSISLITAHPSESRRLYLSEMGLPLQQLDEEYYASEEIAGCRHFGIWPLGQAAQACFGTTRWPDDVPVPQVSVEFELADVEAVKRGAEELGTAGYKVLHGAQMQPWGQTVARLLSPEGAIVGLSYAPSLHETRTVD